MDESKSVSRGTRSMVRPGADHELEREENHGARQRRISEEADDGVKSLCTEETL